MKLSPHEIAIVKLAMREYSPLSRTSTFEKDLKLEILVLENLSLSEAQTPAALQSCTRMVYNTLMKYLQPLLKADLVLEGSRVRNSPTYLLNPLYFSRSGPDHKAAIASSGELLIEYKKEATGVSESFENIKMNTSKLGSQAFPFAYATIMAHLYQVHMDPENSPETLTTIRGKVEDYKKELMDDAALLDWILSQREFWGTLAFKKEIHKKLVDGGFFDRMIQVANEQGRVQRQVFEGLVSFEPED